LRPKVKFALRAKVRAAYGGGKGQQVFLPSPAGRILSFTFYLRPKAALYFRGCGKK